MTEGKIAKKRSAVAANDDEQKISVKTCGRKDNNCSCFSWAPREKKAERMQKRPIEVGGINLWVGTKQMTVRTEGRLKTDNKIPETYFSGLMMCKNEIIVAPAFGVRHNMCRRIGVSLFRGDGEEKQAPRRQCREKVCRRC